MSTIAFNHSLKKFVIDNDKIFIYDEAKETQIYVREALYTLKGEYLKNLDFGFDLGILKTNDIFIVEDHIRDILKKIPGVLLVNDLSSELDKNTRKLKISYNLILENGENLSEDVIL